MAIKAVFFDMDGTLLNTLPDLCRCTNDALAAEGLPTHPEEAYKYFVGNGLQVMTERACPEGTPAETVGRVYQTMRAAYAEGSRRQSHLYEGIDVLVRALKARGFLLAVITNKADLMAREVADWYFPDKPFDLVSGALEGVANKPAPDRGKMACARLGVAPEEVCYVGDTPVDVRFALAAGFSLVGALWGFRTEEELRQAGAVRLIRHPKELLACITAD